VCVCVCVHACGDRVAKDSVRRLVGSIIPENYFL